MDSDLSDLIAKLKEHALGPESCPKCGITRYSAEWEALGISCKEEGQCDWNMHNGLHTNNIDDIYKAKADMLEAAEVLSKKFKMDSDLKLEAGDIVRYDDGSSALVKLTSPHDGGWHGDHVMGGTTFVSNGIFKRLSLANEEDLYFCKIKRPGWFIRHSALQDWVMDLSLMQQSVLMSAIRGCDGLPKRHKSKAILKFYRRSILISAFDGKALNDPFTKGGGSFTGPIADLAIDEWPIGAFTEYDARCSFLQKVADDFVDSRDELHAHYQIHMMHGFEIVGYKHPEEAIRDYFNAIYNRLAKAYHLWPETEKQMDLRLSDNFENWTARNDISSSCSD